MLLFVLILCLLLDRAVFHSIVPTLPQDPAQPGVIRVDKAHFEGRDWYRLCRVMGYAPTWIALAAVVLLVDLRDRRPIPGRGPYRRAGAVVASILVAGIAAELCKLVFGKERPINGDVYTGGDLRVFLGGFADSSNLGFPSSHTAVAFAGAAAAAILWRPGTPVFYLLAIGCGLTRMLSGAHWLSDVFAGAVVGVVAARLIAIPIAAETADRTTDIGRIG
jgi:membrane-associated phospholipid phosphatase